MRVIINYVTFRDVLSVYMDYEYKPTNTWYTKVCDGLNKYYDEECFSPKQGAQDFYKALGIKLMDKSVFYCYESSENVEACVMNKLSRICSKSDTLLDQYLPLYNKLQEDIKSLESRQTTRFNDTPTSQGNYVTDEYTSTITQVTNSVDYDVETQVNYLKEKLQGLIERYCSQFEEFKIWTN